jgi:hypothetical protein
LEKQIKNEGVFKMTYVNKISGAQINVPTGFSWTTLFFGFLVPLFRGDIGGAILMFVAACITFGISLVVFPFIYNKMYANKMLKQGFAPATQKHYSL